MKLIAINHYKEAFMAHLMQLFRDQKPYEESYKWDVINQWQTHFSLQELNNSEAFAQSLKNSYSGRLWRGEKHSVKSGMLDLMKKNPLLMNVTFLDLFDESKDINMRYSRFHFHCDQVLKELYDADDRFNNHMQDDYSISLYLSLQYPESYGLYDYKSFYKFMEMIESRNIPLEQEKDRYFKSLNAIYTVISKDIDFMNGVNFLLKEVKYTGKSLFLINDLIQFSIQQNK